MFKGYYIYNELIQAYEWYIISDFMGCETLHEQGTAKTKKEFNKVKKINYYVSRWFDYSNSNY